MALTNDSPGDFEVVIDGQQVDLDKFTFRELRELKRAVRDITEDPEADLDLETLPLQEFIPAALFVIRRRDNPSYSLDEALDHRMDEFIRDAHKNGNGKRPPTKPKTKTTT